jgi:chromosome segregation ATPase
MLEEIVEKKSSLVNELTEKIEKQENIIEENNLELSKAKLTSKRAVKVFRQMKDELDECKSTIRHWQDNEEQRKEAENEENLKVISDMKDELCELEKIADNLREQNAKMTSRENETKTVLTSLNKNIKEKNEIIIQLKKKIESLKVSEVKSIENAALVENLKKEIESLKVLEVKSIDNLALVEDLKSELCKLEQLAETLQQKNDQCLILESKNLVTIAMLKQDVKDRDVLLKDCQEKTETLKSKSIETLAEISGLKVTIEQLKEENEKLMTKEKELTTTIAQKETANNENRSLVKKMKLSVQKLTQEVSELKEKEAKNAIERIEPNYSKKLKQLENALRENEKLIKTLQKNNDLIDSDLEKALKEKSGLEDRVTELQREMKKKEEEFFAALRKHSGNLNAMKTEVTHFTEWG